VTSCKYNETSSLLAVGNEKGQLSVFDLEKEEEVIKVDEHKGSLNGSVWNMNVVSSAGNDGVVVHTDLRSPELISKFKAHNDEILKIDVNGELLATASRDSTVKIWQGFSKFNFNTMSHFTDHVTLAWNAAERFKLITADNSKEKNIKLWNVNEGKLEKFSHCNEEITCIDVNEKEKCFATGLENGEVALWDLIEMNVVKKSTGHAMPARKIVFSFDGEQVVTGGDDETVRFWQVFSLKKKDDDGFQVEFR
jgi:WD40 repeat protein